MEFFRMGDGRLHVNRLVTVAYTASLLGIFLAYPRPMDLYRWLNFLQIVGWYVLSCRKNPLKRMGLREAIGSAILLCTFAGQIYVGSTTA